MLAAVAWLGCAGNSFGFVGNPAGGWLSLMDYIKPLAADPTLGSPFRPYLDPVPKLDFVPFPQAAKPSVRTPSNIPGYQIYQKWATVYRSTIYYDPFTLDWVGEGQSWDEYDYVLGYRKHGNRTINSQTSNWDTGWAWFGSQPGSSAAGYWPNRGWCGEAVEYQIQENNDPSGYTIDRETLTNSGWALLNWGNVQTPGFELVIGYDLEQWPYYVHYYNALPDGLVTPRHVTRVVVATPGVEQNITPDVLGVPNNYGLDFDPYIHWGWRSASADNSSLPEWVEGWE